MRGGACQRQTWSPSTPDAWSYCEEKGGQLNCVRFKCIHSWGDPPQQPGISSQSSDRDANMVVNVEDLLLVRSQFRLGSLHKHKHTDMFVLTKTEKLCVTQVFDCTFNATRTAWVLDLSPTVAEPCFTASMAYSIWWIRPYSNMNVNITHDG